MKKKLLATLILCSPALATAQWTTTTYHLDGYMGSAAGFGAGSTIYGGAKTASGMEAGTISNSGFSSYNPLGASDSGISAVDGGHEYGMAMFGKEHAARWTGSAATFEDWNPTGASSSYIYTANAGKAGGYATFNGTQHATVWNGGGADDLTDLHDNSWMHSSVDAIRGSSQFGDVTLMNGDFHAGKWSGTAASFEDMNPVWAVNSQIIGATDGRQAGWSSMNGSYRATLWSDSAATAVDLNPLGYDQSVAYDVSGSHVSGTVYLGNTRHAGYWNADTLEFIDLQNLLSGYDASAAYGIQVLGNTVSVYGQAWDSVAETFDAVVWTQTVPEPLSLAVIGLGIPALLVRRKGSRR